MPKLILFAPCERLLVNQEDNNVSLISLLQQVQIAAPSQVPLGTRASMRWDVIAVWQQVAEDETKLFEARCELFAPDAAPTKIRASATFSFEKQFHRLIFRMIGFPVGGPPGEYSLRLSLRESPEAEFTEVAEYPLIVRIGPKV